MASQGGGPADPRCVLLEAQRGRNEHPAATVPEGTADVNRNEAARGGARPANQHRPGAKTASQRGLRRWRSQNSLWNRSLRDVGDPGGRRSWHAATPHRVRAPAPPRSSSPTSRDRPRSRAPSTPRRGTRPWSSVAFLGPAGRCISVRLLRGLLWRLRTVKQLQPASFSAVVRPGGPRCDTESVSPRQRCQRWPGHSATKLGCVWSGARHGRPRSPPQSGIRLAASAHGEPEADSMSSEADPDPTTPRSPIMHLDRGRKKRRQLGSRGLRAPAMSGTGSCSAQASPLLWTA
jgi:hypothetical protein